MVAILVLLTFAVLVTAGLFVARGRRRATAESPSPEEALRPVAATGTAPGPTPAYYLHPGHAWVRIAPDGQALVGASEFAVNFVGALSQVQAPKRGTLLRQGEPAWTLVSAKNRRLTQPMPLDGEIVAVNPDLVRDQGRIRETSHRGEWIVRVRPTRLEESLQGLFGGSLADAWREVSTLRLNAALSPALGRLANDGGVWVADFGDMLEDSVWLAIRRDLFPPEKGAAAGATDRN
jgi:glycine cleavage system H lipoate-binding protein